MLSRKLNPAFLFGEAMEENQITSGIQSGKILSTIQSMIINLFMPVYLHEKTSMVGVFVCPDRNIRITVESIDAKGNGH
jgi:hypothetical protein